MDGGGFANFGPPAGAPGAEARPRRRRPLLFLLAGPLPAPARLPISLDPSLFQLNARVEDRHWWFTGRRRIVRDLVDALGLPAGSRVVDVGCGTGANVAGLADRYRCLGVDPTSDAVRLARERFPSVEFRQGSAASLEPGGADLVLLMDVLEHVEDDGGLLRDALRAVRPGGWLLLTVPADRRLWSAHDEVHGHYRRYERLDLERLWSALPVTPRLVSHYNARLYPVIRAVRAVGRRLGVTAGAHGSDLAAPPPLMNGLLARIFGGEAATLRGALRRGAPGYRRGASLIAILRREA